MGLFDKISEKNRNFKAKQVTKFRNQSYASYKQTEEDASIFKKAMGQIEGQTKENVFCYTFKKPSHERKIVIFKKINFWSLFAFAILCASVAVLFGCLKLVNHVSPDSFWNKEHTEFNINAFNNANLSSWLINCIPQLIAFILFAIYLAFYLPYLKSKNKRFGSNPNYSLTFNLNIVFFIIFALAFITFLPSFVPFNFFPVTLFSMIKYNTSSAYNFLIILTGIFDILLILSSALYIASTSFCLYFNPKFDKNKLSL